MSNVIGSLGDERERVVVLKLLKPVAADSVPSIAR